MIIGVNFFVSRRDGFPPGRSVATSNEISEEEHPKNTRYGCWMNVSSKFLMFLSLIPTKQISFVKFSCQEFNLRNIPRNNENGRRLEMIICVNFFVSRRDGFPPGRSLDTSKSKELVLHFFLLSIDGYVLDRGNSVTKTSRLRSRTLNAKPT